MCRNNDKNSFLKMRTEKVKRISRPFLEERGMARVCRKCEDYKEYYEWEWGWDDEDEDSLMYIYIHEIKPLEWFCEVRNRKYGITYEGVIELELEFDALIKACRLFAFKNFSYNL